MKADCHMHMVLDGVNWKDSIARGIDDNFIRAALGRYQSLGYRYLRDGGDRWGVGARAKTLAPEYGITYRTPLSPLCKKGCYGSFIGTAWEDLREYAHLVQTQKAAGADFVKIMISGLMDFDRFGVLTQPGLPEAEVRALIHIAHEEGMTVMAHCNGADTAIAAARAGVDSVEHGAYLNGEVLSAMAENGCVWVPTVSTVGNLLGKGRFDDRAVAAILESLLANISAFAALGGQVASGSDAGAWAVPHGCNTEDAWLRRAGLSPEAISAANRSVAARF